MIVTVDYGMGNLGSIRSMLRRLGAETLITSDPAVIARADRIILPGVGAFDHAMQNLRDSGLIDVLNRRVREDRVPMLGICLGMQLVTRRSEEGGAAGLGWINADTVRFRPAAPNRRLLLPHMGWNTVTVERKNPLMLSASEPSRYYFVHTYYVRSQDADAVLGTTTYGEETFHSALLLGNIFATQFHPEKSHKFGMELFRNFLAWHPAC